MPKINTITIERMSANAPSSQRSNPNEKPEHPPVSLNGTDWGPSNAEHLIVQDMMDGLVPYDKLI